MEKLLAQATINANSLKRNIIKFAATELNNLVEPCYYPAVKKYYFTLLEDTGLTNSQLSKFVKEKYKGTKYGHLNLVIDPITTLHVLIMYYFLKNKDQVGYNMTMVYHAIRTYTNLMHKQISYCDPGAFRYALEHLNKTHLFVREKTIPGAIYFISQEMVKQYTTAIKNSDDEQIAIFVQMIRHRLSQSVKSFAEEYYRAAQNKDAIKNTPLITDDEGNEVQSYGEVSRTERMIEDVAKRITLYREIDKSALDEAKKLTKVSSDMANNISNKLCDLKYADNITIILKLFIKDIKNVKMICGKDYYVHIKQLMSIKRTSAQIYFKQQISELLNLLIKELGQEKTFNNFSSQTKFLVNYFLAYYITMILRNKLC